MPNVFSSEGLDEVNSPFTPQQGVSTPSVLPAVSKGVGLLDAFSKKSDPTANFLGKAQVRMQDIIEAGMQKGHSTDRIQSEIRKFTRTLTKDNTTLAGDIRQLSKEVLTTPGIGLVGSQGTKEQQDLDKANTEAVKNGYVDLTTGEPETALWLDRQKVRADLEDDQSYVTFQSSNLNLNRLQRKDNASRKIANLARIESINMGNKVQQMTQLISEGKIDVDQGIVNIKERGNEIRNFIKQEGLFADTEVLENVASPILAIEQNFIDVQTGKISLDVMNIRNNNIVSTSFNAALQNPRIARMMAISPIAQGTNLFQFTKESSSDLINYLAMSDVSDEAINTLSEPNLTSKEKYDGFKSMVQSYNQGSILPEERERVEQVFNKVVQGISDYSGLVKKPEQLDDALEFFSRDDTGNFLQTSPEFDVETAKKASEVFDRAYESVVEALKKDFEGASTLVDSDSPTPGLGFAPSMKIENISSFIQPFVESGAIRFRPTEDIPKSVSNAVETRINMLNSKITPRLNKLIRTNAHLEKNKDYKAKAENLFESIFISN